MEIVTALDKGLSPADGQEFFAYITAYWLSYAAKKLGYVPLIIEHRVE